mmetsp:Transcript_11593/g.32001  ORF Transcript_11593/g.32001 Transcript_11593/m.32001 type:complete len:214 (-) Transcript_11593:506-1147(-)
MDVAIRLPIHSVAPTGFHHSTRTIPYGPVQYRVVLLIIDHRASWTDAAIHSPIDLLQSQMFHSHGFCTTLLALRREPFHHLINVGAFEGADGQDHPWRLHDVVELQFVNKLGLSDVRLDVDLVGQHEHWSRADGSIIQQLVQFLLGQRQFLRCGGVHNKQHNVATFRVSTPFASVLLLPAYIPAFHVHISFLEDLDVESDGWNSLDSFPMSQH